MYISPRWLWLLSFYGGDSVVARSLSIDYPNVCWGFVLRTHYVIQFSSIISLREREREREREGKAVYYLLAFLCVSSCVCVPVSLPQGPIGWSVIWFYEKI